MKKKVQKMDKWEPSEEAQQLIKEKLELYEKCRVIWESEE